MDWGGEGEGTPRLPKQFCFVFNEYSTSSRFPSSPQSEPTCWYHRSSLSTLSGFCPVPRRSLPTPFPRASGQRCGRASRPLPGGSRPGPLAALARRRRRSPRAPASARQGHPRAGARPSSCPQVLPRRRRWAGRARRACHGGRLTVRLRSRARLRHGLAAGLASRGWAGKQRPGSWGFSCRERRRPSRRRRRRPGRNR